MSLRADISRHEMIEEILYAQGDRYREALAQIRSIVYSPMVDREGIGPREVRRINQIIEGTWTTPRDLETQQEGS